MNFLPVVERELRTAARRPVLFWIRTLAGGAAIFVCSWALLIAMIGADNAGVGKGLFALLAYPAFGFSLIAGGFATADCLSSEKREGTLGLLFLTDLTGFSVVLGKLAAAAVPIFYIELAIFPVLAIPTTMGGVTGGEFWRVVLVLANTLFFSLAVGMLVSALSRQGHRVAMQTLSLILLAAALPVFQEVLALWGKRSELVAIANAFSPVTTFACAFEGRYKASPGTYWSSIGALLASSWIMLLTAGFILPRSWQEKVVSARRDSILGRFGRLAALRSESDTERAHRLEENPVSWLGWRRSWGRGLEWIIVPLVAAGWVAAWGLIPKWAENLAAYVVPTVLVHSVLKISLAIEACRRFHEDCRSGALELMLATPLKVADILEGQILSLKWQYRRAVTGALIFDAFLLLVGMVSLTDPETAGAWGFVGVAIMIMLVSDARAIANVGLWRGLKARTGTRALVVTLFGVLVVPWIAFGMSATYGIFLFAILTRWLGSELGGYLAAVILWTVVGMIANKLFGIAARDEMMRSFRVLAARAWVPNRPLTNWPVRRAAPAPPVMR